MSAQWVLSGLLGAGSAYALDITAPTPTQIIFVTSFPDGISALTQADSDAVADHLRQAVTALPATATLSTITFNGMTILEYPGAIPADLTYPVATWANYAAGFMAQAASNPALTVSVTAGMICASPHDGVLSAATLAGLAGAWAQAAAALPAVAATGSAVAPFLQVIAPASVT